MGRLAPVLVSRSQAARPVWTMTTLSRTSLTAPTTRGSPTWWWAGSTARTSPSGWGTSRSRSARAWTWCWRPSQNVRVRPRAAPILSERNAVRGRAPLIFGPRACCVRANHVVAGATS